MVIEVLYQEQYYENKELWVGSKTLIFIFFFGGGGLSFGYIGLGGIWYNIIMIYIIILYHII